MFKPNEKVLIVAAHPDDEVLGAGAIMNKYRSQGVKFYVFVTNIYRTPQSLFEDRKRALYEASRVLGFTVLELGSFTHLHTDAQIDTLASRVGEYVTKIRPSWVVTHWHGDVNQDHGACYRSVQISLRPGFFAWASWMAMETLSSTENDHRFGFKPTVFVEVSEADVKAKVKAFCCYEREVQNNDLLRSPRGIWTLASYRGMQIQTQYAESFNLVQAIAR